MIPCSVKLLKIQINVVSRCYLEFFFCTSFLYGMGLLIKTKCRSRLILTMMSFTILELCPLEKLNILKYFTSFDGFDIHPYIFQPAPGQVATKQQESDFEVQHKRILTLFRRQLSVPLNCM